MLASEREVDYAALLESEPPLTGSQRIGRRSQRALADVLADSRARDPGKVEQVSAHTVGHFKRFRRSY
jgi:hypothetical protein